MSRLSQALVRQLVSPAYQPVTRSDVLALVQGAITANAPDLSSKQDAATAATDAEVAAAVATLQAAATAATDAELSAAVATINSALAAKQDSSTAATDAELAAAIAGTAGLPTGGAQGTALVKNSATDGDASWATPPWGGGDVFKSGYYSFGLTHAATTSYVLTNNRMYLRPFWVTARRTFDRIGVNVTGASTAASGGVLRMGIYGPGNGEPGALILDAGTVSSESMGAKEIAITQTLNAGVYWLACVPQVEACSVTALTSATVMPWLAQSTAPPSSTVFIPGMTANVVSGALPGAHGTAPAASSTPFTVLRAA